MKMKSKSFARLRAGISIVKNKPCFSPDSKYLFASAQSGVKVFVTKTSECLHDLNADHGEVIACYVNPKNELQLITVSCDGYICFWNYEDAVLVGECVFGGSIYTSFPHNNLNGIYLVVEERRKGEVKKNGEEKKKDVEHVLVLLKFNRDKSIESNKKMLTLKKIKSSSLIAYSKSLDEVAVAKRDTISIFKISSGVKTKLKSATKVPFTCVTWHPSTACLATGNDRGVITLWKRKNSGGHDPADWTPVELHWHSAAVTDISFTFLGSYFYSVGQESVLVKWKNNSNERQFLPRIGMPLCQVTCAPQNNCVAVSHVDNSIDIVDVSTNNVEQVIQGLASSHHWEETSTEPVPTGLLYDPRTGCLVLNGRTGYLQFYNLFEDKHYYSLDITQANYISAGRKDERAIHHLRVTKAAFDGHGDWLATVEYWCDGKLSPIVRLKFWRFLAAEQSFSLNTAIEAPHASNVNTLLFQPLSSSLDYDQFAPLVITTSDDKRIRFWNLMEEVSHRVTRHVWTCGGSGTYLDLLPGAASFSEDGTVLAVAFANNLTLWDSRSKELRTNLCHSRIDEEIKQVVFGRVNCSHLLVCATKDSLIVWDILSLSVLWCVQNSVVCLVGDLATENMAAFTPSGQLFVFKPTMAEPIAIHTDVCQKDVICATFIPQRKQKSDGSFVPWLRKSELIYMDSEQRLYTLSSDHDKVETSGERVGIQRHIPLTPFGLMLAEQRKSGVEIVERAFHDLVGRVNKMIIKEILSTPSQVLPAPADLCKTYLNCLLKPIKDRTIGKLENGENEHSDEDSGLDTQSGNEDSDSDAGPPDVKTSSIAVDDDLITVKSAETVVQVPDLDGILHRASVEDYTWLITLPN